MLGPIVDLAEALGLAEPFSTEDPVLAQDQDLDRLLAPPQQAAKLMKRAPSATAPTVVVMVLVPVLSQYSPAPLRLVGFARLPPCFKQLPAQ